MKLESQLILSTNTAWKRVVRKTVSKDTAKIEWDIKSIQKSETSSSIDHDEELLKTKTLNLKENVILNKHPLVVINQNTINAFKENEDVKIQELNSIVAKLNQLSLEEVVQYFLNKK